MDWTGLTGAGAPQPTNEMLGPHLSTLSVNQASLHHRICVYDTFRNKYTLHKTPSAGVLEIKETGNFELFSEVNKKRENIHLTEKE